MPGRAFEPFRQSAAQAFSRGFAVCTEPSVAVLPIDWATFRRARKGRDFALFRGLLADVAGRSRPKPELSGRLAAAGLAERRQLLDGVVRDAVGTVLKIAPSRLDPRKVLGTMGLNSLMAMELRNRLEMALGRPLSATLAWNYPTVEAIVAHLAGAEASYTNRHVPKLKSQQPPADLSDRINQVANLSDEQAVAALRA